MKVKEICKLINGRAFKPSEWDTIGVPIIRIQNLNDEDAPFNYFAGQYDPVHEVKDGELLFSWSGTPGTSFGAFRWYRGKGVLNQHIFKVVPIIPIDKDYLMYALNGNLHTIISKAHGGVGLQHITKKELDDINIPVPEIKTQYEIVTIINQTKEIIAQRLQELRTLDLLVKARFVEMFGEPRLNPHGYPVHQLSEHIQFLTSGSRGWAQYCVDDGKEWFITIKNVKDCHISTANMQTINAPDNAEAKRTRVEEGDLLISITADLGRTGVVTQEIAEHGAYINQHLTCIRLNRKVLEPLYVAYFMESAAGKEQFISKNQSAVKAGLNFNSINTLQILIPPIETQQQFLHFVDQIDKSKVVVQGALDEARLLFDSLMQKYFG